MSYNRVCFCLILVATMPSNQTRRTGKEDGFKKKVEQIRHLGGDAWLGLLNELQNGYNVQVFIVHHNIFNITPLLIGCFLIVKPFL